MQDAMLNFIETYLRSIGIFRKKKLVIRMTIHDKQRMWCSSPKNYVCVLYTNPVYRWMYMGDM